MVWNKTQLVGIGLTFHENLAMLVCNYYPRGNIYGHFQQNISYPAPTKQDRKIFQKLHKLTIT